MKFRPEYVLKNQCCRIKNMKMRKVFKINIEIADEV